MGLPRGERLKRWFVYAPSFPGLPTASSPNKPAWALRRFYQAGYPADERRPPSVLSPFAQLRCYRRWGDVLPSPPRALPPRSSLLRAHVPLPLGSLCLRRLASFRESLQVVLSPCCP